MYTGERILPRNIFNVTYQQSLVAYEVVEKMAAGKTILDVACGEGYGSSLLAREAREVVGVDYDMLTMEHARARYKRSNLQFVAGDFFNLKSVVEERRFDIVCCFQTIEHFTDHDVFLQVLKSVVRPQGVIAISTPNRRVFSSFNPYHVHELDYDELRKLFARHFASFTIYAVLGDDVVWRYRATKQRMGDLVLKMDILELRTWLPSTVVKWLYQLVSHGIIKRFSWLKHKKEVTAITTANFTVSDAAFERALDFIVVATVDT